MLIVFDLDGTLVDSRRDLADAANALIVERGGTPLTLDAIASMVGEGAGLLVRRALAAAGLDAGLEGSVDRFLQLYDGRLLAHTRPYPGVRDTLESLAGSHDLAVLTNKPARASCEILDGLGLIGFFAEVYGGDGPHARKPDPAGLRGLMAAHRVDPAATVMVGDSRIDLETARAAGTGLCIARYGFGYREREIALRPDEWLIETPSDLLGIFRSPGPQIPRSLHR